MTDQPRFNDTEIHNRAAAIELAAEVVGLPDEYRHTYSGTGTPRPAQGIRGAFGSTDPASSNDYTYNAYPSALIEVAAYIVSGRIEADQ